MRGTHAGVGEKGGEERISGVRKRFGEKRLGLEEICRDEALHSLSANPPIRSPPPSSSFSSPLYLVPPIRPPPPSLPPSICASNPSSSSSAIRPPLPSSPSPSTCASSSPFTPHFASSSSPLPTLPSLPHHLYTFCLHSPYLSLPLPPVSPLLTSPLPLH
ncbi:hypothetical protein Pcinc_043139 [Petrolisthes cinctipes]|uniref:Uncharacterized protein n=1 Tax=Petrolisthes cinctipes TaxID=88211 RepID=A0AAE1BI64_PETCI|nr:hypothetical protein Pcinc_043139 [Petrolisthes cinctipes]